MENKLYCVNHTNLPYKTLYMEFGIYKMVVCQTQGGTRVIIEEKQSKNKGLLPKRVIFDLGEDKEIKSGDFLDFWNKAHEAKG